MSGNPFPGPRPYTAQDRARFYARDVVIQKLANQIRARAATTVFGPSGAGKSSLMQAGVIPVLEESKRMRVVRVEAWPPEKPALPWLVSQLHLDFELGDVPVDISALEALEQAMELVWRQSDRPLLVYLDQLEQLFLGERDLAEVDALCAALAWLVHAERSDDVRVVLSLREDYLGRWRDATRDCFELSAYGFRVAPLSVGEMVKAMCRTALAGNPGQTWTEPDLYELMLDVRVPGQRATESAEVQTAFGQIVCRALWDERAAGRDVRGANAEAILRRYLDTTLAELGPLQGLAEQLLEAHLVDDQGHRRILTEKEARQLLGGAAEVLDRLDAARVLRAEEHQGSRYFELGHDWLAKKVLERRVAHKKSAAEVKRRQEESQRQAELRRVRRRSLSLVVYAVFIVLAMMAIEGVVLQMREGALAQEMVAKIATRQANDRAKAALMPLRMAGARELLATDRPGLAALVLWSIDEPERVRGWSQLAHDILATPIPLSTRRHEDIVHQVAWSPDSERIVATAGNVAYVWRADGTDNAVVLRGHKSELLGAAFSSDGTLVVTSSRDEAVRVWRADGQGEPVVLGGDNRGLRSAAFSPDGKFVVTSAYSTALVWRSDGTGEPVVLRGHEQLVNSAGFSSDGKFIVTSACDNTARVWRADGQGDPVVLKGHTDWVNFAAFSIDGKFVVTNSLDKTVRVWRADGQGEPTVLKGHTGRFSVASFSADGRFVVTNSSDNTAWVWRADGQGEPVVLRGHERRVRSASFSADGKFVVTSSDDKTVRSWRADGTGNVVVLKGHLAHVNFAAFSPDGKFVATSSDDKTLRVWRVDGQNKPGVLKLYDAGVNSAAFSPDGKFVVTSSDDNTAQVWQADGQGQPVVLKGHRDPVYSAMFSANGKYVVTKAGDKTARVWRADGQGEPVVLEGGEWVNSAEFSPDGKLVVAAMGDNTVRVWRADGTGEPVVLKGHHDRVTSARFSPDGNFIVTPSYDHTVRVWRADGQGEPVVLRGHNGWVNSAAFSPDGVFVATASRDYAARVWRADGVGKPVLLEGHKADVNLAEFSPDGKFVVTGSADCTARVWRADGTGAPVVLEGHEDPIYSAKFSPDGKFVVTSSGDKTARVWRADGSGESVILRGHENVIHFAGFSPDGNSILTHSADNTVRIWPFAIPWLQQALRNKTTDCLTPYQRETYLLENPTDVRTHYEACERSHERTPLAHP